MEFGFKNCAIPSKPFTMINTKDQLYQLCLTYIDERINTAQFAIQEAQAASREETKSSAGDKYETARAMAQLEIEKCMAQCAEADQLKGTLVALANKKPSEKVQAGSLVITDRGNFYLSIPAGQFEIENQSYFSISVNSPLGSKLVGLKAGEDLNFRDKRYRIERIL